MIQNARIRLGRIRDRGRRRDQTGQNLSHRIAVCRRASVHSQVCYC
jgi:hypothetical protein